VNRDAPQVDAATAKAIQPDEFLRLPMASYPRMLSFYGLRRTQVGEVVKAPNWTRASPAGSPANRRTPCALRAS